MFPALRSLPSCTSESEKLHFEPSQNATVTNCDKSGANAVVFCDLSHFVIMAVTAQTQSNNTENVFWVLGRVPMFTFDMNMKSCIFAHFGIISLLYLFVCMDTSYKAHKGNLLDSIRRRCKHVSCTEEYTLLHYGNESEKLHFEPSQNVTVTTCDKSGILVVAFCDLSNFVIIAVTAQTVSNNTGNVFWVLGRVPMLIFDRNLRGWVLTHCLIICHLYCILFAKHEVPEWTSGMYLITLKKCSRYLGYYCCKLLTSFWDFGFEPLLNCLSAQISCEKIRWCCWNHVRTDAINKSHISIY